MTNTEIVVYVLSKLSGKPEAEFKEFVTPANFVLGEDPNAEVPDEEASKKIESILSEMTGVRSWIRQKNLAGALEQYSSCDLFESWNCRN